MPFQVGETVRDGCGKVHPVDGDLGRVRNSDDGHRVGQFVLTDVPFLQDPQERFERGLRGGDLVNNEEAFLRPGETFSPGERGVHDLTVLLHGQTHEVDGFTGTGADGFNVTTPRGAVSVDGSTFRGPGWPPHEGGDVAVHAGRKCPHHRVRSSAHGDSLFDMGGVGPCRLICLCAARPTGAPTRVGSLTLQPGSTGEPQQPSITTNPQVRGTFSVRPATNFRSMRAGF